MINPLATVCLLAALSLAPVRAVSQEHGDAAASAPQTVSKESIKALGKVVNRYIEKDYAVGAELLVIKDRQSLYHEVYGDSDRVKSHRWAKGTICNIRSMSKPITGVAAQILIDRNQIELNDPVAKYLPSFDNEKSRNITVKQLLTHRSGLPLSIIEKKKLDEYPSLIEQVNAIGEKGPEFEPDSKFWYSDDGSDVLAAVIERVSGQPLDEFVTREIFQPLKMTDTFYGIDATDPRFSRIATLYFGEANAWRRFRKPENKPLYPFARGSQTIYSTPVDYAKFLTMLMDDGKVGDRQLLSREAIARILRPVSTVPYPTEFRGLDKLYGQMMIVYRDKGTDKALPAIFGHGGSDGTASWAWPNRDLIVLYFTQSRGGATASRLESEIDRLLIHPGEMVAAKPVPEKFQPYVGTFVANFEAFVNEEFTVKVKNGKLTLDIPSQLAFELLEPNDKGEWAFALAPTQITVTFERDESGQVHLLKLHQSRQTFEVPRKGTARAIELARNRVNVPQSQIDLWDAVRSRNVPRALEAIKAGADINGLDIQRQTAGPNGRSPLNYAAMLNDTTMIEMLIKGGAEINISNHAGYTPLHHAATSGSKQAAILLIEKGAEVNAKTTNRGRTALLEAVLRGYTEIVQLLLEKGANVHVEDHGGRTALMWAKKKGRTEIIQMLNKLTSQVQ